MTIETKTELAERLQRVQAIYDSGERRFRKMQLGPVRTKLAKHLGCILFTILSIESKMREG
jgi:hypothetical protein